MIYTHRMSHALRTWLAVLLLAAAPALADDVRGMAWRATDGSGNMAYIVGTVHAANPDFYPLPSMIDEAFDASDGLLIEVDTADVPQSEIRRIIVEHGFYTPPQTLELALDADTWQRAADWANRIGLPIAQLARMRPWLAANTLVTLEMLRLGFDPQFGLDRHFMRRASETGIATGELETLEEQFNALSGLPQDVQMRYLVESLHDAGDVAESAERIIAIWRAGDLEAMGELLDETFSDEKAIYDALMRDRNLKWLPRIERSIASGRTHFVAVGALHMAGPDGLIALLEEKGYILEQM